MRGAAKLKVGAGLALGAAIAAFAPAGYESDMPADIKSSWPEEIRRRHAAMSERAKT